MLCVISLSEQSRVILARVFVCFFSLDLVESHSQFADAASGFQLVAAWDWNYLIYMKILFRRSTHLAWLSNKQPWEKKIYVSFGTPLTCMQPSLSAPFFELNLKVK